MHCLEISEWIFYRLLCRPQLSSLFNEKLNLVWEQKIENLGVFQKLLLQNHRALIFEDRVTHRHLLFELSIATDLSFLRSCDHRHLNPSFKNIWAGRQRSEGQVKETAKRLQREIAY